MFGDELPMTAEEAIHKAADEHFDEFLRDTEKRRDLKEKAEQYKEFIPSMAKKAEMELV